MRPSKSLPDLVHAHPRQQLVASRREAVVATGRALLLTPAQLALSDRLSDSVRPRPELVKGLDESELVQLQAAVAARLSALRSRT